MSNNHHPTAFVCMFMYVTNLYFYLIKIIALSGWMRVVHVVLHVRCLDAHAIQRWTNLEVCVQLSGSDFGKEKKSIAVMSEMENARERHLTPTVRKQQGAVRTARCLGRHSGSEGALDRILAPGAGVPRALGAGVVGFKSEVHLRRASSGAGHCACSATEDATRQLHVRRGQW